MNSKGLDEQIEWLEKQIAILEPSDTEATVVPEGILKTLKSLRSTRNSAGVMPKKEMKPCSI